MKNILILGGTSDMAYETAKEFAKHGWSITLAGRSLKKLEVLEQDLLARFDVPVVIEEFDVADFDRHQNFYTKLNPKPDVTACFVGYLGNQALGETNWQEAHNILTVNYVGAVSVLNIVANEYEKQKRGIIVGVSSVAGERGRKSNYLYGSAKAGFSAYLSGLRNRLYSAGVHVVTVKPGFVRTKMTQGMNLPAKLTAEPEQVAKAIYKACSKKENVIYVKPVWRLIMENIKLIPESLFKKMSL